MPTRSMIGAAMMIARRRAPIQPWPRPGTMKERAAASTAERRIAAITRDATAGGYDAYRMEGRSMIVRSLDEVTGTERDVHGEGWRSQRLLLRRDGLGFSLHNTTVAAGAEMELEYRNHLEACYFIAFY